jgi:BASS family bile acid:Na+ symporter
MPLIRSRIDQTMKVVIEIGVLFVLVLMMVAVGTELEGRHFRAVARRKGLLLLTLASQAVVLPALGLLLIHFMQVPPHLSAGILLLAACPVGDMANFFTLLAQANLALSVTLNTISCLLSVVTMAVIFKAYGYVMGEHFVFSVPTPILIVRLTLMVVLPVLFGMLIRRFKPAFVVRYRKAVQTISIGGIVYLLVYIMVTQRERLVVDWLQTAVAGMVFILLAMLSGFVFNRLLQLTARDGVTICIGFAVRNVGLALAIAVTLLNRIEFAIFAAVYFITEAPLLLGAVAVYRKWGAPVAQQAEVAGPPA